MPPSCSGRSSACKSRQAGEPRAPPGMEQKVPQAGTGLTTTHVQKTPAVRCARPHLVTLKILKSRTQRNTEMPRGDMISSSTKIVSVIPPHTTKQSNRLKRETKYAWRPKLYIFTSISQVNRAKRTLLAISRKTKGHMSSGSHHGSGSDLSLPASLSPATARSAPRTSALVFALAPITEMRQERLWSARLSGSGPTSGYYPDVCPLEKFLGFSGPQFH